MAAHTYWDLYFIENNGAGAYCSGVEIEMFDTEGGTDLCTGGTAFGSAGYYAVANGFDNSNATIFAQNFTPGTPGWIGYQFASPVDIVQFSFTCEDTGYTDRAPKTLYLRYSDDALNWTIKKVITGQTGWSALQKRTFNVYEGSFTGNITESFGVTDWVISAFDCNGGDLVGYAESSTTSYTIKIIEDVPVLLTISPKIDGKWAAATAIASGYYVVPTAPDTTPRLYKCTTAGTTHATTEPTWPTSGTVSDGTAVWTFIADLDDAMFKTLGAKVLA